MNNKLVYSIKNTSGSSITMNSTTVSSGATKVIWGDTDTFGSGRLMEEFNKGNIECYDKDSVIFTDEAEALHYTINSECFDSANQDLEVVGKITVDDLCIGALPTASTSLASGDLFTQTATQLGGSGTTKVVCVV